MTYKARYTIDIDFSGTFDGTDGGLERIFQMRLESSSRDFAGKWNAKELNAKFDYVEANFPDAMSLFFDLLWIEADVDNEDSPNVRKISRDISIQQIHKIRDAEIRRRLPAKSQTPKPKEVPQRDRESFIEECVEEIKKIGERVDLSKNQRIKTELGRNLGSIGLNHSSPIKALNRTLEKFELSLPYLIALAKDGNMDKKIT